MHTHTHTLYSVCVSQLISEALSPRGTTVWLMAAAFTPSASLWESKMAACFHGDNRCAPLLGRWMKILRVPGEADGGSERKGGHGFSRSVLLWKKPSLMMMHVLGSPGWCPAVQKSITELVTSFLCSCVMFSRRLDYESDPYRMLLCTLQALYPPHIHNQFRLIS